MLVKSEQIPAGTKCDQCGDRPATLGHVAQGATGRWCEVMWVCRPCGGKDGIPAEEARQRIWDEGNGWPDF